MKQTAVEWLFEQLCSEKLSWNKDSNGKLFFDNITSDILQQAKEMEKKHREQTFVEGYKARALASNLIFDEASKLFAKSLFEQKQNL